jgi:hypothetical protein
VQFFRGKRAASGPSGGASLPQLAAFDFRAFLEKFPGVQLSDGYTINQHMLILVPSLPDCLPSNASSKFRIINHLLWLDLSFLQHCSEGAAYVDGSK